MDKPPPDTKLEMRDYIDHDTLRDGRKVIVRAIRPDDKALLQEGMQHLSTQSQYFRFFTHKEFLSEKELQYFTEMDFVKHVALFAGFDENGQFSPAATGRYIVTTAETAREGTISPENVSAEIAVTVVEEFQGLGFATILLKHLIKIARLQSVQEFKGTVLPGNQRMLNLVTRSGLPCKQILNDTGEWEITLLLGTA
ncbi:MAG: GNAT family N-acetyltransferase [Cyanobacteria bacterium REEB67]|nr:GNAT family N-acetyltransferase [Cyanobacteria bacterium REEB67]